MPSLTAPQAAQLTAAIHETALVNIDFTAPTDGYKLAATATYREPDAPTFRLGITWADNGHGVLRISETIEGAPVTAAHTSPHHRIALNQLQRLLTLAIRIFRDHVTLAEMDAANARRKARTSKSVVTIAAPTTDEARTSTAAALSQAAHDARTAPVSAGSPQ